MKFIYYITIVLCMGSVISMCQIRRDRDDRTNIVLPPLDTSNKKTEESDPRKQANCKSLGSGGVCVGNEDCEDICDDVFDGKRDRDDCEELNVGLVASFEALIEDLEDGETDIDLDVLECLIDIDEEPIADAVRKMSQSESKDFLTEIAENENLASILESEDNGMVLENLLKEAGYNNLADVLGESDEDENFLYLVGVENNESAFNYLEDYVSSECEGEENNDCPGGDEIRAYCKGFLNWDEDNVEDFLDESEVFADEYEDVVDDSEYTYDVEDNFDDDYKGDFLDFCQLAAVQSGGTIALDGTCPSESNLKNKSLSLGKFTFDVGYFIFTPPGRGSVDTDQDIIKFIRYVDSDSDSKCQCIRLLVTVKQDVVASQLYLEDSNGDVTKTETCNSNRNEYYFCIASPVTYNSLAESSWYVYLANETSNTCEFYVPYRELGI